jgi:hypothetical protein
MVAKCIFYILLLLLTKIVITVKLIRIIQANNASNKASVSVSLSAYARRDIEDAMELFIIVLMLEHILYIMSVLFAFPFYPFFDNIL